MSSSAVVDNIISPNTVKLYHTAAKTVWPGRVFYICRVGSEILVYSLATSDLLFLVFTFSVALVIDLKDVIELLHVCHIVFIAVCNFSHNIL